MSDPIVFSSSTPLVGLPLLIAGQAQKEFFVNQALSVLDALHARAITASQATPPAAAPDGACYRVTSPASGAWVGKEGAIAIRINGGWHFVAPSEGLALFDRTIGSSVVFRNQWQIAPAPALAAGGTVVDVQARAAINAVIEALRNAGLLGMP